MTQNISNRYSIKIPENVTLIYSENKKLITLIGPIGLKSFKIRTKVFINSSNREVRVSRIPLTSVSNKDKKLLKATQGTTIALFKQFVVQVSRLFYLRMKFVGVGYRAFYVEKFENSVLLLKLGYSHLIYFRVPFRLKTFCWKFTRLVIFGSSYQDVCRVGYLMRSCRRPEPYKGKGIRYEDEKIELRQGKRV